MNNRAYSLLDVKSFNDKERVFEGIATTPSIDRVGDIVDPLGAEFSLPMPLLLDHDSRQQVGHVEFAKPNKKGIPFRARIAQVDEPGPIKDMVDSAWQLVKARLRSFVSIGFKALDFEVMPDGGINFKKWAWFELSLVSIPAQAEAVIFGGKSLDEQFNAFFKSTDIAQRAASGPKPRAVVLLTPPGASGNPTPKAKEGKMPTLAEQITALETKRAANAARMEAVMQKSIDEGRSSDQAEQEEFDTLEGEVESIDQDLVRLKKLEKAKAVAAKPVIEVRDESSGIAVRGTDSIVVKRQVKSEPGIDFARLVKVKLSARLTGESPLTMAKRMYGPDSEVAGIITKANEVVAGTTIAGNWAADLVSAEGAAVAAFLEFLRPETILGKFGTNGVPNLTRIDFYSPYVIETGGGDAYWVGEGKPKPLTSFDYDRSTLTPLKIANIAVLTEENIRYSTPNSDTIVRAALVKAIAKGLDVAFIDPSNSGSANVKPASITYGAATIASTGDDADDIRLDVRSVFQKFIDANNAPKSGVWIMSATNALALSMMVNALGQPEFSGITMDGGRFQGLPVIVSQHIGDVIALVNTSDVLLGDEGGVAVDMSREASIEMRSTGIAQDATAGTATTGSVSMFQTNSVALRAERTINWKRARPSAVAYLTSVDWGGEVATV